jgi:hypothetical protein
MIQLAGARSERRRHPRQGGNGLIAEIRGKKYEVLDISFGGIKVRGRFTVAGGLVNVILRPKAANAPIAEESAEVRGRVERVEGNLTAVRFNILTDAVAKLIAPRMGNQTDNGGLRQ